MVLILNRCAEECHDAIALNPGHRASKPVYRVAHHIENVLQPFRCALGIVVADYLGRALNVGEHD